MNEKYLHSFSSEIEKMAFALPLAIGAISGAAIAGGYFKGTSDKVKSQYKKNLSSMLLRDYHVSQKVGIPSIVEETLSRVSFNKTSGAATTVLRGGIRRALFLAKDKFPHYLKEAIPEMGEELLDRIVRDGILTEKIDGARANIFVRNDGSSGAASHRISKRTGEPIDYTDKLPGIEETTLPKGLGSKMDLVGEVVFTNKKGKVLPHQEISGILNSKPVNAIAKMEERKLSPKVFLFDIHNDSRPYLDKLDDLGRISKENPGIFVVPKAATSAKAKQKLIDSIRNGENIRTSEGVVWQSNDDGTSKYKFKKRTPVTIHSTYATKTMGSKYEGRGIGGFRYSLTPGDDPVGQVGSGMKDELRFDMFRNPEKYIGKSAIIEHQGQYKSTGAFRAPAFKKFE